jgi:hypothetical protein
MHVCYQSCVYYHNLKFLNSTLKSKVQKAPQLYSKYVVDLVAAVSRNSWACKAQIPWHSIGSSVVHVIIRRVAFFQKPLRASIVICSVLVLLM